MEKVTINVPSGLAKMYGFENGLQLESDKFEAALQVVVDDAKNLVDNHRKGDRRIKSNPLCNLIDAGLFTVDRIIEEMPKLEAKTSSLPSGQRKVLYQAIEMAMVKMLRTAKEELEEKMKGQESKTE